jgi:hypothetical protein
MLKVKQKISGCFRGRQGAEDFMLIRSYLLTCSRHNIDQFEALRILSSGAVTRFRIFRRNRKLLANSNSSLILGIEDRFIKSQAGDSAPHLNNYVTIKV